jgi:hypothetical protein
MFLLTLLDAAFHLQMTACVFWLKGDLWEGGGGLISKEGSIALGDAFAPQLGHSKEILIYFLVFAWVFRIIKVKLCGTSHCHSVIKENKLTELKNSDLPSS